MDAYEKQTEYEYKAAWAIPKWYKEIRNRITVDEELRTVIENYKKQIGENEGIAINKYLG